MQFNFNQHVLDLSRPKIMGVLNVTPDSFSDGGRYNHIDAALKRTEDMIQEGASIIDVGGESTRPGAALVSTQEELNRVIPIVEAISQRFDTLVSMDTSTPEVIAEGAKAGAHLINDVRALQKEGALDAAVASGLPVCLMHMQGQPDSMQANPQYKNVVDEVSDFLLTRTKEVMAAGIAKNQIILDPGFGFGKTKAHNYQLLNQLNELTNLGFPILTGLSRKRMIADLFDGPSEPEERDALSAQAALVCALHGSRIIRVHNVQATEEALRLVNALMQQETE